MYDHVDRIWEGAKVAGQHPADRADFDAVAGMRDLLNQLVAAVDQAAHDAGDPDY